ncbi:polymerase (RNA) I associated factor 1 (predicted) [Rattus norvegicus]|uniref:Polymerase (RNA) I associated factor 1 (Predicted) n=3 Tax=Rattus norvegicus TaxID=10116 RepID=A0A9K3Y7A9_RAT|nr:DNA-directed RNA polymerase I subunit RPA49 [Rattus norvegicus]AAI58700.1 Polymerase (RNA) I polypeptide E [Rattus norvegicus]EDL98803.1 polymerase (RNA) I associated factor 1 (predicted) [Rattus norvegicus]|eukprot:NP_001101408.1 DNA-directed RNA polymerase I subunit RPA49 [Rattus norvegicus]
MATPDSPGMDGQTGDTETEVLQSARWQYCGEPDDRQKAVLVQFSNGKLQNPGNMRFTLYNSTDLVNPRQKCHRILAAETDRLSYVGNNFGTGALKCNTLCRHFVGILNKTSGQMEVYDAEVFNMQPLFAEDSIEHGPPLENQNKTFRDKLDSCIEAFGSTKQKRSLNSRRMNKVGSESLNFTVAKAAESIIDTKGVSALVSDAMQDDLQNDSLYLPPCHADATKPEDVYRFEDILSPAEYDALESPSEAFRKVMSEDILKMVEENSHCSFIIEMLKSLPADEVQRNRQARSIWFLDALLRFRAQKVIKGKSALGPGIPHIINTKLLKQFTCLTYNNGSLRNLISSSMKAKITAYAIILALHINNFQIDLTVLQRDLKLSEKRMIEIARAMRLKISKRKVSLADGREEDHRLGTLSVPLPPAQTSDRQSKRKKMS